MPLKVPFFDGLFNQNNLLDKS